MSWDVLLLQMPSSVANIGSVPHDFAPEPLGSQAEVVSRLQAACPTADFSDHAWGVLDADQYWIEFSIADDDPVESVTLLMRGGDGAVAVIAEICAATGWSALDTTTGEVMQFDDSADPAAGLRQWRAFRDQVVNGYANKNDYSNKH